MAETEPRNRLIIKLRLPRSEKRGAPSESSDSPGEKRRKVVDSASPKINNKTYCVAVSKSTETDNCGIVKENSSVDGKDSKTPSFFKDSKKLGTKDSRRTVMMKDSVDVDSHGSKKKVMKVAPDVSPVARRGTKTLSFVKEENSRADSRTGSKEHYCALKINDDGVECKKEKKMIMDRCKKMQCWVILKRMMIGKDGWAFKNPLDVKVLEIEEGLSKSTENSESKKLNNSETRKLMRPMGFEDIEGKLKKWLYSGPDEFADDLRLVFSHGLLYPPRSEIHRIARRLSESFEVTWKSLKEKWTLEERKGKKICKRGSVSKYGWNSF